MSDARDVAALLALLERGGLNPTLPEIVETAGRVVDEAADLLVSLVARRATP